MKKIDRIIDYIESWFYYPKMKKYLEENKMSAHNPWRNARFARFKYAWWHSKPRKLKE